MHRLECRIPKSVDEGQTLLKGVLTGHVFELEFDYAKVCVKTLGGLLLFADLVEQLGGILDSAVELAYVVRGDVLTVQKLFFC